MQQLSAADRIMERDALAELLAPGRRRGRRLVFTNGCFDLLHPGHVRYLAAARRLGDLLVVGINSDASVRRLKGAGRPVQPERERAEVVAALRTVDYVTIFDEDTPWETIRLLQPDVLVKGGDWPVDRIVGRDIVEGRGGIVASIEFERGYSTSELIRRVCRLRGS
ncbi:MAG: D-glycero-beta-D-manno-heptose 1-phosphate adenylyltransferase [Acidobacteriota bacterium]